MKRIILSCILFVNAICYGQIVAIGDDDLSAIGKCMSLPGEEVEDDYYPPDFKADLLYYKILSQYSDSLVEVYYPSCDCNEDANYSQLDTLIVPEKVIYKGKTYIVKGIGWTAFSGCYKLKKVVLPNTITYIGHAAFSGCDSLMSINIPTNLKRIGTPSWDMSPCLEEMYKHLPDSIEYVRWADINPF